MVAKLYKVAENSYVVADDIFIQRDGSEGKWVSSAPLDEDELRDLISGQTDLDYFDLDEDEAAEFEEFIEVPRDQWLDLPLP